jgi:predicted secreted protein
MPTVSTVNTTLLKIYTGATPVAITDQTGASLSISHDLRNTTTKDSAGWEEYLEGMRSAEMSGEGLYAYDHANGADVLFDSIASRLPLAIVFQTAVTGDKKYSCSAFLTKLEINSSGQDDNVTFSFSLKVSGAIVKATV